MTKLLSEYTDEELQQELVDRKKSHSLEVQVIHDPDGTWVEVARELTKREVLDFGDELAPVFSNPVRMLRDGEPVGAWNVDDESWR